MKHLVAILTLALISLVPVARGQAPASVLPAGEFNMPLCGSQAYDSIHVSISTDAAGNETFALTDEVVEGSVHHDTADQEAIFQITDTAKDPTNGDIAFKGNATLTEGKDTATLIITGIEHGKELGALISNSDGIIAVIYGEPGKAEDLVAVGEAGVSACQAFHNTNGAGLPDALVSWLHRNDPDPNKTL